MSAFVEDLTELVATLGPLDGQDDNFSDGANALADALKAAEGSLFRIDQDAPRGDQAYVIRIEAASGHRLKTTISQAEVEQTDLRGLVRLVRAKSDALFETLLVGSKAATHYDLGYRSTMDEQQRQFWLREEAL